MLVRKLLKRCGPCVTRRWLSEGKRSSSGYVQAAQDALVDNSKYVVRSNFPDFQVQNVTIPELVWEKLDRWPDRTALVSLIYFLDLFRFWSNQFYLVNRN